MPLPLMIRTLCVVVALGAALPAGNAGAVSTPARPVSLAADDFDADGVRDLACGYATASGGVVTIARGNAEAVYGPGSLTPDAAPPFFAAGQVAAIQFAPDVLAAGDFDNDGHRDLVAGALGGDALLMLAGDGRGALAAPHAIALPGKLTALANGDVNRIDGLADLVVAVDGSAGPRLLVLEGPDGAIGVAPEVIAMPARIAALAIGQFDADGPVDVAAAAGSDIVVIHGRDRKLVAGEPVGVDPAKLASPPAVDVRATGAVVRASDLDALSARTRAADALRPDAPAIASLSMRLNADAIDDLVLIEPGRTAPTFKLSRPAATFAVTTTADDGPGSLRFAIVQANASAGTDLISFNIAGAGVHTIQPLSPLPVVIDPVTIDATTEPGYSGTPLVEIDGSLAGPAVMGLQVDVGSTVVRGLIVNRFRGAIPDGGVGVYLQFGGGNIVEGNYLGIDAEGTADRANEDLDIYIYESADNLIGGTVVAARNVIAGSCKAVCVGIEFGDNASANLIRGNYIGTDVTGTLDLNAVSSGIFLGGGPNTIVGGTDPGARNVISGNGGDDVGFDIFLQDVHDHLIQGNYIGTDPTGLVGVATSPSGNVIMDERAINNTIGGTAVGAGNRIGFAVRGIEVGDTAAGISNGNRILGNSNFEHLRLGLALGYDDVTPNDAGDTDTGPNNLQNFPVLTSAIRNGDTVTITGRLNSISNAAYRIELFSNTSCNPLGFGNGETFLSAVNVTTSSSGTVEFTTTVPSDAVVGPSITATATDSSGNTSEFSMCVELELSWMPPDANAADPMPAPRDLSVRVLSTPLPRAPATFVPPASVLRGGPTSYRIYSFNVPGVQPSPSTFFTSVPANQTSAGATVFVGGTFFVVTAVYPDGESGPSNEVETGTPPTIAQLKAKTSKISAKGSGFTTDSVLVTLDGIPFQAPAKVKGGGTKVVQAGLLVTGESIGGYARTRPGGVVTVLIRNSNGGIEGRRVTVP